LPQQLLIQCITSYRGKTDVEDPVKTFGMKGLGKIEVLRPLIYGMTLRKAKTKTSEMTVKIVIEIKRETKIRMQ
jgi:hypothetical protein